MEMGMLVVVGISVGVSVMREWMPGSLAVDASFDGWGIWDWSCRRRRRRMLVKATGVRRLSALHRFTHSS